jgi:hypothetical protein
MTNVKYNFLSELDKGKIERGLKSMSDKEVNELSLFYKAILENPKLYNYKSFAYESFKYSIIYLIKSNRSTITMDEMLDIDIIRATSPVIVRSKKSVLSPNAKKLMRIADSEEEIAEDREEFIKQVMENYKATRQVNNLNLNKKSNE